MAGELASPSVFRRVQMKPLEIAAPPAKVCGVVEIEMNGARIRVEPGVELATLATVLAALRGIR
ncbi:hypothetical protein ACVWXL_009285 [Bradyrhizobium sp. GM22.5]